LKAKSTVGQMPIPILNVTNRLSSAT